MTPNMLIHLLAIHRGTLHEELLIGTRDDDLSRLEKRGWIQKREGGPRKMTDNKKPYNLGWETTGRGDQKIDALLAILS